MSEKANGQAAQVAITLEDIDRKLTQFQRHLAEINTGNGIVLEGLIHALIENGAVNKAEIRESVEFIVKRLKLPEIGQQTVNVYLSYMEKGWPERKGAAR